MEDDSESTPKSTVSKKTQRKVNKSLIYGLIVVLVLGLVGYGSYFVYQKLDSQQDKLSSLESKVVSLENNFSQNNMNSQINDLQQQIFTMQDQLASGYSGDYEEYVPPKADITIDKVFSYNDASFADFQPGESILIVDLLATNKNDSDIWLSSYEFKLKGQDNTVYPVLAYSPLYESTTSSRLPDGRLNIFDVTLAPNESVKGSFVFYLSKVESKLTLYYQDQVLKDISL